MGVARSRHLEGRTAPPPARPHRLPAGDRRGRRGRPRRRGRAHRSEAPRTLAEARGAAGSGPGPSSPMPGLLLDVSRRRVRRNGQPRPATREARLPVAGPCHRRPAAITVPPSRHPHGRAIPGAAAGDRDVPCADLLPVVQEGRPSQRQLDRRGGLRHGIGRRPIATTERVHVPRDMSRAIVVGQHDRRPATGPGGLPGGDRRAEGRRRPRRLEEDPVEHEVTRRRALRRARGRRRTARQR